MGLPAILLLGGVGSAIITWIDFPACCRQAWHYHWQVTDHSVTYCYVSWCGPWHAR